MEGYLSAVRLWRRRGAGFWKSNNMQGIHELQGQSTAFLFLSSSLPNIGNKNGLGFLTAKLRACFSSPSASLHGRMRQNVRHLACQGVPSSPGKESEIGKLNHHIPLQGSNLFFFE